MSIAASNRTPEHQRKITAAKTGVRHTVEARAKMSQSRKGRKFSEAHKANLAAAMGRYRLKRAGL